jgi:hypothetical protein
LLGNHVSHYDPARILFPFVPGTSIPHLLYASILVLVAAPLIGAPDTVVVCQAEFRPVLSEWLDYRQRQGHRVLVIPPEESAEAMRATIRGVGASGQLKFLVLVGDVPHAAARRTSEGEASVPTNYLPAKINSRWGSEPTIASDAPYADLDGDYRPDLAVGRIPADSSDELATVLRKVMRYEQQSNRSPSPQRIHVVAGLGGFGVIADTLVEAAARQVFRQSVPPDWEIHQLSANPASPHYPPSGELAATVRRQLSSDGLAWIYLGHGLPTELDRVPMRSDPQPILSVADIPRLRCGEHGPIAALIACYSGAIDSQPDCLAEELLVAERGPAAVIAATRVTMPYGNTVLGYELLRACFADRPAALGNVLRLAQGRTVDGAPSDTLRKSLDMLAIGISPSPIDLAAERREHVMMYHLLGDPLTRLPLERPRVEIAASPSRDAAIK